jgi:indole-3-glycerol phosphate synthase
VILDDIVAYKRSFVAERKRVIPLAEMERRAAAAPAPPPFAPAIRRAKDGTVAVIAEVKKASPSKGVIRPDFDPLAIAREYRDHGAAAVSVLTDEKFFQGHLDYLRAIRIANPQLPILRKDFILDEYQLHEAREAGASAVLLIAGVLDRGQLRAFRELAAALGLDALTEVHSEDEAETAVASGATIIGVNNRDLRTFAVDLCQTERVVRHLGGPREGFTFVAESGIASPLDVEYLRGVGVDAILVGESLMRQPSPGAALGFLMGRGA